MKNSETLTQQKDEKYDFDPAAEAYSKSTDAEAAAQVANLKEKIREIRSLADLGSDPAKVMELRHLTSALAWYKANKNRSKYFRIDSNGPSMRHANRHAKASSLVDQNTNKHDKSPRAKRKERPQRKTVSLLRAIFSRARIFDAPQEETISASSSI